MSVFAYLDHMHESILQLKRDEMHSLEHLALEKLVNAIAKGVYDENSLLSLPRSLHSNLVHRLTRSHMNCPGITMRLTNKYVLLPLFSLTGHTLVNKIELDLLSS